MQSHMQSLSHTVGMGPLSQNVGGSSLPSLSAGVSALNRSKEPWNQNDQGRMDSIRFPGRSGQFGTDMYGSNGSLNYRPGN